MRITGHELPIGIPFSWSARNSTPAVISASPMVIRCAVAVIAIVALPFLRLRSERPGPPSAPCHTVSRTR